MPKQRSAPLMVDQRRVILDVRSTELWVGRAINGLSMGPVADDLWPSVFTLANVAAYHLSRAAQPAQADELLTTQLLRAGDLLRRGQEALASAALDAQLNRVRLAAIAGEVDTALQAIEVMMTGREETDIKTDLVALWSDLSLPLTQDVRQAVEIERLLIKWRSGLLGLVELQAYVDSDRAYLRPLLRELSWRIQAERGPDSPFVLEHSDTLKRAMHRFVVWTDIYPEGCLNDASAALLDRALDDLPNIPFVCPSTPSLWARRVSSVKGLGEHRRSLYNDLVHEFNAKAQMEAERNVARLLAWSRDCPTTAGGLPELSRTLSARLRPNLEAIAHA